MAFKIQALKVSHNRGYLQVSGWGGGFLFSALMNNMATRYAKSNPNDSKFALQIISSVRRVHFKPKHSMYCRDKNVKIGYGVIVVNLVVSN